MKFQCGIFVNGRYLGVFKAAFETSVEYYQRLRNILQVKRCEATFQRIGRHYDGGYLMLPIPSGEGGIAYSYGINTDVSWDTDMAERGYQVYMYDHTIEGLPYDRPEFHFFREGIASSPDDQPPLYSLMHALEVNGHVQQEHMILKMDVEGAEWGFLQHTPSTVLAQFDQISFELHDLAKPHTPQQMNQMLYCLQKLQETHELVHLHPNNFGMAVEIDGQMYADVLEATYVRKGLFKTVADSGLSLPNQLDEPNNPNQPDIILGKWNA